MLILTYINFNIMVGTNLRRRRLTVQTHSVFQLTYILKI